MQAVHGPVPAVTLTAATGVRLLTVSAPCAALGGLGAALVFLVAHQALIDDAYITLDYARSLAQHGQWALVPGHPANTATSPLNVLLLAGLIVLSGHPVVSVGILLIEAYSRRLLLMLVGVANRATDRIPRELSSNTRSLKDGPPRVPYYRLQQRRDHRVVRACSCDRHEFWR